MLISEPELGLSMDLAEHEQQVWAALQASVAALPPTVEHYAVACITLHYFADRLHKLGSRPRFVSAVDLMVTAAVQVNLPAAPWVL